MAENMNLTPQPRRDEKERMRLELEIANLHAHIEWSETDITWISSQSFRQYMRYWRALKHYYVAHDDPEIGIIAVHAYERATEVIRLLLIRRSNNSTVVNQLQLVLEDLEYYMDEILREGSMAFNDFYAQNLE